MVHTIHARRSLAVAAAATLMALGAVAAAPGASATPGGPAQTCCHTKLSVDGPAAVGLAGAPVDFTEKITNTSATESEDLFLNLLAEAGDGMPQNGLGIWYQSDSGAWQRAALEYHSGGSFDASLPFTITLGPKETRVLHLRFGLPMGEPHNGDTNGGATSVKLTSSVGAADGSNVLQARDVRTVKVQGTTSRLTGVPATAVAGGAPVEFEATVANPTASEYVNVSTVLYLDRFATVKVYRNGSWVTLTPGGTTDDPDAVGYYLRSRDYTAPVGSSSTVRVRISWNKAAPLGKTRMTQSVIVNEGAIRFRGSYVGAASAQITLVRGQSSSPTPTGSSSTTPTATPTATSAASAGGSSGSPSPSATSPANTGTQLAHTGGDDHTFALSVGAAGSVMVGGAAVAYAGRRRRRA